MIPINSASEFKSFLDDLREWTTFCWPYSHTYYSRFTLYAKFPDCQYNSYMNYGETYDEKGKTIIHPYVLFDYEVLLKGGFVPYNINEQTVLENNGEAIIKERKLFTYAPCDQVVFFGVDVDDEQEFLEWRASKSLSE